MASFPHSRTPPGKWGGARAPGVRGRPAPVELTNATTASTRLHPGSLGGSYHSGQDEGNADEVIVGSFGCAGGVGRGTLNE